MQVIRKRGVSVRRRAYHGNGRRVRPQHNRDLCAALRLIGAQPAADALGCRRTAWRSAERRSSPPSASSSGSGRQHDGIARHRPNSTTYRSLGDRPANVGGSAIVATRIELDAEYATGLDGIEAAPHLIVFYWCRRPVGAAHRSAGRRQAAWHLREKARATTALAATEPTTWCRLQARRPRRSRRGRPRGVAGQGPT